MENESDDALAQELLELKKDYQKGLPSKLATLEPLWNTWMRSKQRSDCEKLYQLLHKITGSSGSYGFEKISAAARELELFLKDWAEATPVEPALVLWAQLCQEIQTQITELS